MSEQISTLLDGELAQESFSKEIQNMLSNKKAIQTWRDYQIIGDVMRATPSLSETFTARLMDKIELEPTVLAPNALPQPKHRTSKAQEKSDRRLPVVWSMAASCAAVLVVGWAMVNQHWQTSPEVATVQLVQLSDVQSVEPVAHKVSQNMNASIKNKPEQSTADVEMLDAPLEYLAAHHASAPSISSYYIQAASFSE